MVREGLRFTAQAFQQMSVPQRTAVMTATLRDIEASLVDAALSLFEGLIGRAYNRAKKRVEDSFSIRRTNASSGWRASPTCSTPF